MDPLFYLPAATLIIGAGMGLIIGRVTSGAVFWRRKYKGAADQTEYHKRRADAAWASSRRWVRIVIALQAKEDRRMAPLRAANARRQADAQARRRG